jgi:hypothetical protein
MRRDGGIGRRAGLRIQCRKACRFESCSRHHKIWGETWLGLALFNIFQPHENQARVSCESAGRQPLDPESLHLLQSLIDCQASDY